MMTKKKILTALALVVCAVLLVVGSVAGTLAYMQDSKTVTNTFTVGNVSITLDEAPVDANGKEVAGTRKTDGNSYHLIPGGVYDKDPTVTVLANSERCYLFAKVVNPLESVEGGTTIAAQLVANGWKYDAVNGIYVYNAVIEKSNSDQAKVLFETVTVKNDATNETLEALSGDIVVTAYAVQADGFANAAAAWTATFGATTGGGNS